MKRPTGTGLIVTTIEEEDNETPTINNGLTSSSFISAGTKQAPVNDDTGKLKLNTSLKTGLSEKQIDELREIFRLVDVDGGGTISKDELQILMKTLGIRASAAELDAMVDEIDAEKTGEIDFPSFVAAMSRKVTTTVKKHELKKAFKLVDSYYGGKSGHITYDQLINILCYQAKSNFTVDDAAYMINQVVPSLTQSGSLDYLQFMELYKEAWEDSITTPTSTIPIK